MKIRENYNDTSLGADQDNNLQHGGAGGACFIYDSEMFEVEINLSVCHLINWITGEKG